MNREVEPIFELVKRLTKTEKRYFKLSSKLQSGGKIYMKFFDIIDSMDRYDEEKLKKQLKDPKLVKRLAVEKRNLLNQILRSLDSFYTDESKYFKLHKELKNAYILHRKGLEGQAIKTLKKVIKKGVEFDENTIVFEAWSLLNEIYTDNFYFDFKEDVILDHIDTIRRSLKNQKDIFSYKISYASLIKNGHLIGSPPRSQAHRDSYNQIYSEIESANETGLASPMATYEYLRSKLYYWLMINDIERSRIIASKLVNYVERELIPKGLAVEDSLLAKALKLLILTLIDTYDEEGFHYYIKKLEKENRRIEESSFDKKVPIENKINTLILRARMEFSLARFDQALLYLEEINKIIKEKRVLSPASIAQHNVFYIVGLFSCGELRQARKEAQNILDYKKGQVADYILIRIMLLNLVINIDLEEYDTLPYLTKSVYRFLLSKDRKFKYENILLKAIRAKFFSPITLAEDKRYVAQLKLEFEEIIRYDEQEKTAMGLFDIVSWLEGKIEGLSYREALLRKAAK